MADPETPSATPPVATPAPAAPADNPNTATQHGSIPEHLVGVTLKETFLPEDQEELPAGQVAAKTPEEIAAEAAAKPPATSATPSTPAAPATPAAPIVQPKNTQNEEIVDKTTPGEPKLLAGKYKDEAELRHAIEEIGGDHSGVTDVKELEQIYHVANRAFTKYTQRQKAADDLARVPAEPETFQPSAEMIKEMVSQLDFDKIENAQDMAAQMFQIMFTQMGKTLPSMLPKAPPPMDPVTMAAEVKRAEVATDSLGYIEAKVPRLTKDPAFRNAFARHLADGKKSGKYPAETTREVMTTAMKDFQKMLADMAGVPLPADTQDKAAAAVPDGAGGTPPSVTPTEDPDEDILGSIVGAKIEHDKKFA